MTLLERIKAVIEKKDADLHAAKCAISRLQKQHEAEFDELYNLRQTVAEVTEFLEKITT